MVAPTDDRKESDPWGLIKHENLEEGLRESLNATIRLPPISERHNPTKNDLALELIVTNHQGGNFFDLQIESLLFLIFWRPKIEVKARLYNIDTGKTINSASSGKTIPWGKFIGRIFSLRGIFGFKPLFRVNDMEIWLCQASIEVLSKLIKQL